MGDVIRRYRVPTMCWAAVGTVLILVQRVTGAVRTSMDPWAWPGGRTFFASWVQFDGWEYLRIADDGYWYRPLSRSPIVFFPLYPLAVRSMRPLAGDLVVAGVIVSAVAGLAATLLFWKWLGDQDMSPPARLTSLAVLLLYPFGWYLYGVVYADALFLALVLGSFLLVSKQRYLLAGLVGALATAARPTGLALVPGLFLLGLHEAGVLSVPTSARGLVARWKLPVHVDRTRFRAVLLAPLLSFAGIAAYATYLGIRFGKPFVFLTDQTQWQGSGIRTLLKAGVADRALHWDDPVASTTVLIQTLLVVAVICSVPAIGRRFGWGYAVFVLSLGAILTLESRDYLGAGRYLMAAFPVAALVGEHLAVRPLARAAFLGGCAALLVLGTVGFAQSRLLT